MQSPDPILWVAQDCQTELTKGQKISRPASQPCRGPTPQENRKMVTTQDPLTGDQNCQAHKEDTEREGAKTPQLGNHRESPIKDRPLPLLGKTFWKKMNSQMTQRSWTRQTMKLTMKPHPKAPRKRTNWTKMTWMKMTWTKTDVDENRQTKSLMDLDLDLVNYFDVNKQEKGDLEPVTPPAKATSPKAESNTLKQTWYLEPNKVRFMDDIDTHRANVGRHIPKQGKLVRAKIVPHLVFVNPPASPDEEQPPMDTTKGEASPQPTMEEEAVTPEPVVHSEGQSPKERPNSLPIPLEPLVMDLSKPKKDLDLDCLIMENPGEVSYKPKRNWAKRRMEQTKKTLVLLLPRCDDPKIKRERDEDKQEDRISSKTDEKAPRAIPPPTPESENNPLEELD